MESSADRKPNERASSAEVATFASAIVSKARFTNGKGSASSTPLGIESSVRTNISLVPPPANPPEPKIVSSHPPYATRMQHPLASATKHHIERRKDNRLGALTQSSWGVLEDAPHHTEISPDLHNEFGFPPQAGCRCSFQ